MENPDNESTQVIDLAALRSEPNKKPKRKKIDLYEVSADCMAGDTMSGLVRRHNEDAFACCCKPDGYLSLAVIADGIGGRKHGEIASSACIATMIKEWRKFSSKYTDTTWENAQEFLIHAVMAANDLVYKTALQKNIQMGTTIAAVQFADRYAVIANAGDSRVYRLRDHQLELLSTDHTPAAEAFARGEMTWEEAQISPLRNRITRAIGVAEFAVPQLRVVDHKPGDCYLLCSDGLTGHVSDSEILQEMDNCYDPTQCIDHLMKRTLRGGAHDNTTIISIFA